MTVYTEGQALLIPRALDHDRATVTRQLDHPPPQLVAHPAGQVTHENTGRDFQQPPRDVPPQSGRHRGEDEDYHGTSS